MKVLYAHYPTRGWQGTVYAPLPMRAREIVALGQVIAHSELPEFHVVRNGMPLGALAYRIDGLAGGPYFVVLEVLN